MSSAIRIAIAAATLAALVNPALTFAQAAPAKPDETTCLNAFDKPVKAGTKWCRAGEFWVCQKDGKWFNLKQSCAGGEKGGAHPAPIRKKL